MLSKREKDILAIGIMIADKSLREKVGCSAVSDSFDHDLQMIVDVLSGNSKKHVEAMDFLGIAASGAGMSETIVEEIVVRSILDRVTKLNKLCGMKLVLPSMQREMMDEADQLLVKYETLEGKTNGTTHG